MSAVDLEQWVNKPAKVTFRNGTTTVGTIQRIPEAKVYPYALNNKAYTCSGIFWTFNPELNIVSIEENPMNTTKLQKQIEETQKHLEALQQELKKQQDQERFNQEFFTPIKAPESANACLTILKTKTSDSLQSAFLWDATPQGYSYWSSISDNSSDFSDDDFNTIKTWLVNYLIQVHSEGKLVFT